MKLLLFIISFILSYYSAQASLLKMCKFGKVCECPSGFSLQLKPYTLKDDQQDLLNGFVYQCIETKTTLEDVLHATTLPLSLDISEDINKPQNIFCGCNLDEENKINYTDKYYDICKKFPAGCGYNWKTFDWWAFKKNLNQYIKTDTINCDSKSSSMCTSAVFLGFTGMLKFLKSEGKITEEQFLKFTKAPGTTWKYINNLARPDTMVSDYGIGIGKILEKENIPSDEWPKKGDLVQIWRQNKSGHSTIFNDYLYDESGKKIGICYWSSQPKTNGYGEQCESLEKVNSLTIGRITL